MVLPKRAISSCSKIWMRFIASFVILRAPAPTIGTMSSEQNRLASFGQAEDRLARHYSNAGQQRFIFHRQQARCARCSYQIWAVADG